MLIECSYCRARVGAKEIGTHHAPFDPEYEDFHYKVILLECPDCKNVLLARQMQDPNGEWHSPERVWPAPNLELSWHIPDQIRHSLQQADKCFKAGIYDASVLISGRAIEAMCHHFQTKNKYLAGGLKELLDREIIDKRLFQWSEELRKHRNIAAHASDKKFTEADASDLFDFAIAICDYVFVLNEKFNQFMKRNTP